MMEIVAIAVTVEIVAIAVTVEIVAIAVTVVLVVVTVVIVATGLALETPLEPERLSDGQVLSIAVAARTMVMVQR
jgi:hypothetical protein